MTSAQMEQYRQRLTALARRIQEDANTVSEQALSPSGGQAAGELSNVPMHLGDMGTDEYLHDLNVMLLENEQYLIDETHEALARIDLGTYGTCENCQRKIMHERLMAIPYTRHCTACASRLQDGRKTNLNEGRPHSPKDTFAPEGEMGDNRRPIVQAPRSDQVALPANEDPDSDLESSDFE